jgi:hypothetical protein
MSGGCGACEKILVEEPRVAAAARMARDHDPIDMGETLVALPEPQKIRAVIGGSLVEGEQEGVEPADARGAERPVEQE